VGLLGGTFDPPHVGHLWLASAVRDALQLDEVWLVPAGDPWQKSAARQIAPAAVRLEMVRAACTGLAGLVASPVEIGRDGPTYTVETLERLRDEEGLVRPWWILGADAAAGLTSWHRYADLQALCRLVVTDRPGSEPAPIELPHTVLKIDALAVSSTTIRERVRQGQTIEVLCPGGVVSLIEERRLYRDGDV
jgi:nicotinate-nucleotide adenylyltransferase